MISFSPKGEGLIGERIRMSNVTTTIKDGAAVIAMDDGKANALGAQMWTDLNLSLIHI